MRSQKRIGIIPAAPERQAEFDPDQALALALGLAITLYSTEMEAAA